MVAKETNQRSSAAADSTPRAAWIAVLVLSLVGVVLAAKLTEIHARVYLDPGYRSFCAVSASLSCDSVAQSRWSIAFGVPVSVWGILAYAAMAFTAVWGLRRGRGAPAAMLVLGSVALLTGGAMAVISVVKVHSMCPLCLGTYVIDLVAFVLALAIVRRTGLSATVRGLRADRIRLLELILLGVTLATVVAVVYPPYWKRARTEVELATGVDSSGNHWIGAADPKVTIVEFSDYQCPHCQRGHQVARALVAKNPSTIRLVHRNFPLDRHCNPKITQPFHEEACRYAALAICAGDQHRFWAANDYVFERRESDLEIKALANELGIDAVALERCMADRAYQSRLDADIQSGIGFDIDGTPTYFVNGKKYPGILPPEILNQYAPKSPH